MASEAIITEELICKAAEQLAAEGMRPTNETVRELLAKWTSTKGGSYATIGPVLRAWKARLVDRTLSVAAYPPPTPQHPFPDVHWSLPFLRARSVRLHPATLLPRGP